MTDRDDTNRGSDTEQSLKPIRSTNRALLYLLLAEIVFAVVATSALIAGATTFRGLNFTMWLRLTFTIVATAYALNVAGALTSLIVLTRVGEREVRLTDVMGHVLNWIYVLCLAWWVGFVAMAVFMPSID